MTAPGRRRSPRASARLWSGGEVTQPSSSAKEPETMRVSRTTVFELGGPETPPTLAAHEDRLRSLEQQFAQLGIQVEERVGHLARQIKHLRRDVDGLAREPARGARRPG
ncbi:hypothetical protein ACSRUE_24745 [Sorangium sp. KYC3313]|uniref:hypothetical protein n=1 Tax=Sorangium sp. KYC3313 TaxID=3449740 RepID=UPI003F8CBD89